MSRGLLEVLLVALPKVLGGLGMVVLNMALLRHLGPEPFGKISLCLAGVMLADAIIGSAFDMGVLRLAPVYRETNSRHSHAIEKAALVFKFLAFAGCGLLLACAARPLGSAIFHDPGDSRLILLSCAAAGGLLMLRTIMVHLQVERRFMHYGLLDLAHQGLRLGGVALLLLCVPATPGRVLAVFGSATLGVFLLAAPTLGAVWRGDSSGSPALAELLNYVKWYFLTFSVTALAGRLDMLLLTAFASMWAVGIFSGGFAFAIIPELVGSYLAIVLSPRIMPAVRSGKFCALFRKVQLACSCGAAAMLLALLPAMGLIERHLLPSSFARSAPILLALLPGTLATMTCFPLTIPYLMFVRPTFLLRLECCLFPFAAVAYYLAIRHHGALGAAWVTTASRLLKAAVSQLWAWQLSQTDCAKEETISAKLPAGAGSILLQQGDVQ